jgi:hypothetical protein
MWQQIIFFTNIPLKSPLPLHMAFNKLAHVLAAKETGVVAVFTNQLPPLAMPVLRPYFPCTWLQVQHNNIHPM